MTDEPRDDDDAALRVLWACLEAEAPLLDSAALEGIPAPAREWLLLEGVIVATTAADHVACPDCPDGHVEEVTFRAAPDGTTRYFIACPASLRVEVDAESLRQWTVDADAVARAVAGATSLRGRVRTLTPGRLWRLGTTDWQGTSREVLFARGITWADGRGVAARVGAGGRGIVLVPDRAPTRDVWPGRVPAVVPLSRVASLAATGLALDLPHVAAIVREADDVARAAQVLPLEPGKRNLVVRRQLKGEIEAMLEDDVLVAAYKRFGSYREAARALSLERGAAVTKDKVYRAVRRKGGVGAAGAARADDSGSVSRGVASHRRDGGRRMSPRPKSPPGG